MIAFWSFFDNHRVFWSSKTKTSLIQGSCGREVRVISPSIISGFSPILMYFYGFKENQNNVSLLL